MLPVEAAPDASVMPPSLNVTFVSELRLLLCSEVERECLMIREASVAPGQTNRVENGGVQPNRAASL